MSERVIVTGWRGFVGTLLVHRLKERGDEVILYEGDVRYPDYHMLPKSVDAVWHLASHMKFNQMSERVRKEMFDVNVTGTIKMVEMSQRLGAKFIHISTAYVAGELKSFDEFNLIRGQKFRNSYEETKFLGEAFVARQQSPFIIFRPPLIVGGVSKSKTLGCVGGYYRWAYKFGQFVQKLRLPIMFVPKDCNLNLVSVEYVVDAMLKISKNQRALGKTFNLTHPSPVKVSYLAQCLFEDMGLKVKIIEVPRSIFIVVSTMLLNVVSLFRKDWAAGARFLKPYWESQLMFKRTNADAFNTNPKPFTRSYIRKIHKQILGSIT